MTSSGLLTNAYEGMREKTIFPFGQRKRQLSMDLGHDKERAGPTVFPQGEKTSIDSPSDHVTSDHVTSDAGQVPSDCVSSSDGTAVQGNGVETAPKISSVNDTSSFNTTPVTTAKLESSPLSSQPVSTAVPQTPTIPGYVPRKRGRPKGSTTKNRRVKVAPGGLNLWAPPKNINTSKLSTLEIMALAAQNSQQSQSQFMASLLLQQQQKQSENHSSDALQLALAYDPNLQNMLQRNPLPQQQRLLNHLPGSDSQANSLLELQLRQEIEKLEKILLNHDQRPSSSVIDTALVNQLIAQNNPPQQDNILSDLVPNSMMTNGTFTGTPPSTFIQNRAQSSSFAPDLSGKEGTSQVMEESVRDTILREAMMKLEQHQTSVPVMPPLSHSTLGLSSSENNSQWSHENFLKTCLPGALPSSAVPCSAVPSSAVPSSAASSRKEDDEVTKQFMDVIKTLSSGNKETAQLLQLLLDQTRTSPQVMKMSQSSSRLPGEASTPLFPPQSESSIMKQSQCTKSMVPADKEDSARISDLEQLISSLKSPAQGNTTPAAGAPWPHNFGLPKPRARTPATANGTLKSTERRKHRGRPRKYPEQFYNVVNGKMKYPGAKERRMFFPSQDRKYCVTSEDTPDTLTQKSINEECLENNISTNDKCAMKTEPTDAPANTPAHTSTPQPSTTQTANGTPPPAPHTVPARKRGRPKGSKNKPLLITSPQQLLDLRFPYPSNAEVWSGMPGIQQSQIAAVLSGLNHKLNRQWTSFTV